ncbi:hybrid non-ribosomal peptide synthetase/type I polyketide synthase [Oceanibaculum pacificum]|uniref:Non-ribosomal peptide synthetase n=1 Tax=Oceanibaculum pacificum TaxID=580166 RepID=A0A154W7P3_9PROT|nr:hybrid non-ribosomal peptide synthetase/type I polyketide synthase [Oceanibaculum pacificum]KZD09516.1 hypothetical protein AUP43_07165 [Oceanibaculum pacificum]
MKPLPLLFAELSRLGVTLEADAGALRVRGPAGAVSPELRAEMAARKPEILARLTGAPTPLTFNQRRLWFVEKLSESGSDFTMSAAWELRGALDIAALRRALGAMTRRQQILRARILEQDDEPYLDIAPWSPVELPEETTDDAAAALAAEAAAPFDLADRLFRARLFRLPPTDSAPCWLLTICLHHLIADRWSMGILFRELAALMRAEMAGTPADLPDLPLQYADFAAWQRAGQTEETLARQLDFWRARLAHAPTDLALPLDRSRPAARGSAGAAHSFPLPAGDDLSRLAARQGVTAFMAGLAVYAALLARWTGQDELVIGCPLGNREMPETHDLIGFFVNTVALRLDLSGDPDFPTLLGRVRAASLEAFAHQDVPFDRVVNALKPTRHLNRGPLFQAMFVLQNAAMAPLAWPGIDSTPLSLPPMAPEVDLNLALEPPQTAGAPYTGYLEYDPALFDAATAERFGRQFAALAQAIAAAPETPLSRLPIEDGPATGWPGKRQTLPATRIDAAILDRLRGNPDSPAVLTANGETVTAGELAAQALALAGQIAARGLPADAVIGVALPRGPGLIAALLGTMAAGAAFAVLPPGPAGQIEYIVRLSGLTVAIADADSAATLPDGVEPLFADRQAEPLAEPRSGTGVAYICFTSGSSGAPKGIMVGHAALANHAQAIADAFALTESDRALHFAAPAFDVALEEIFPTLLRGGIVVIPPAEALESLEAFGRCLRAAEVTIANLPAPFWHAWVRELAETGGEAPPTLRLLVTGSDRVHVAAVRQWQRVAPGIAWMSGYGPSEATVTASLFDPRIDDLPAGAATVPLGRPLANVDIHLVDPQGAPVATGIVGEIVIEGAGVAEGYLSAAEPGGFRPRRPGGPPAYWTGDLGRRTSDGALEFIGRRDGQLKIRGVRVEPTSIEAVLASHPQAGEVAVTGRPDGGGTLLLCASVTGPVEPSLLRQWAADRLPAAMVPALIERLEALPRTANGKLDRRALAARPLPAGDDSAARPLADDRQKLLAGIFAEVLECRDVGPDSNFFALGGDSIRSLQIVSRARRAGLALTARSIFQHQTVAAIAAAAQPLQQEPEGPSGAGPLPLTPIYAWFGEQMTGNWRHFNQAVMLALPQPVDKAALEAALTALVDCHDMLRLVARREAGAVDYTIPEKGEPPVLAILDLAGLSPEDRARRKAEYFAGAQRSLDPAQGRNLAAILLPDEARLMLTIHHLCIDVLSWSALLDDLQAAYEAARQGRPPRLRRAPTSFRLWAERLRGLAERGDIGDLPYWIGLLGHPADRLLPQAGDAPGMEHDVAATRLTLKRHVTAGVLRAAPAAFGVRPDTVILAALLLALHRRGGRRLRIDLERNGRVGPFEDLDLSRTVGWFTAVLPLLLEAETDDPTALLRAAGKAVAESPLDGLGFGLLRHVVDGAAGAVLGALPPAEILLNFVGTLTGWEEEPFRPVDEPCGPTIAPDMQRPHLLELNAGAVEGRLRMELSYPGAAGCDAAAKQLLDDIAEALADIARAARASQAGLEMPPDVEALLPLTPLQHGILLHSLREPETYFDQLRLTLHGPLDAAAMRTAWERLSARHPALRASFGFGADGEALQLIHDSAAPEWRDLDWRELDETALAGRLHSLMAADRATGFDLARPPLMRLHLVRSGEARHELVWSAHHLLMDGWSVSVLMTELCALYREAAGGAPAGLAPAPDFARYLDWLQESDRDAAAAFWRDELRPLSEPSLLAGPGLTPEAAETAAPHAALPLSAAETRGIERLARASGVTVGSVLQGAWALLLRRYTGLSEVAFGLTVSGRSAPVDGIENMVGMLINTVPVRVSLPGDMPVTAFLGEIAERAEAREAFAATPLPDALAAAGLSAGDMPFDSLVLIQNYPRPKRLQAGAVEIALAQVAEATNFPLTLVAEWGGAEDESCRLAMVYDPRRLGQATARQLLGHLRHTLLAMADDPAARLDSIPLHDTAERDRLLALGRGRPVPVPPALAHEILGEWAQIAPGAPAVVSQDGTLTYRALAERSDALAARLAAAGIGPGSRIVLAAPRSSALVVGFMAILKAGGAVVPLDIAYPQERLRFVLEDSAADLVLTDGAYLPRLPLRPDMPVLLLDGADADAPLPWSPPPVDPESPAYVIYTSGSTGQPKGVLSPHRGLRALIAAQRALFGLQPGDRVLQFASLSFDASVWEIVMALGAGAALHLPSREDALAGPELGAYLRQHRITAATLPPSLLAVIPEGAYPDLRILAVAGEACPPALAQRWVGGRRFFNAYGPSEATVCATIFEGGGNGQTLPIGWPLPNVSAHVVDDRMEPVPPGGTGELLVGGAGVALGYIGRPELTAERFVPDRFGPPGTRLYRTGDRVRLRPDGALIFLGRIDRQVKLRGFRIEPGEIEAAIAAQPGIAQALVAVRDDRLLAWALPKPGVALDLDGLRTALKTALPGHMVPAQLLALDAVPLTRNGKIDWAALPDSAAPAAEDGTQQPSAARPGDNGAPDVAQRLAALWCDVLGRPSVGPDDNFFDLGGHSLLLVQVQGLIKRDFAIAVPMAVLFAHPTLRALTRHMLAQGAATKPAEAAEPAPAPEPPPPPKTAGDPIAVVGMAGRFPGAADLDAFWRLLIEGREGIARLDRDTLRQAGVPEEIIDNPAFVPAGGLLDEADGFDPAVFGLGPRDALVLDPQHRVFLECAWHALENAGYAPGATRDVVGLFAGSGHNTWLREMLLPAGESLEGSSGFHLITGNDKDFLATQTAYRLDLTGPAVAVQTACSTSLVAVAMAVEALRAGRCDMALAGGVSIRFPQGRGYLHEPDMILSPDGHCRSFAADAAGTVPGSGVGLVLLKPLSRAQADGDRVLAVIRGAAINNDGARKMGFTTPGVAGQAAVIRLALDSAGLDPADIDYVEAHGTATALGDPAEATALAQVYGGRATPLLLGSVKSNIGHADAAAGIAGLIKTVLALHHGQLPPSLHSQPANPRINFAAGPFELVDRPRPWPRPWPSGADRPARAGVSSFGIGGTNAHVILEAAPPTSQAPASIGSTPQALLLSAQTKTALQAQAALLAAHLRAHPADRLEDVAFTLQCGRAALRHRRAVVARGTAEAIALLEAPEEARRAPAQPPAIALLLPGQGSQHPRMGQALHAENGIYRREFDALSDRLNPMLGLSLSEMLYGPVEPDAETLRRTEIAQPAIFAVSLALARHWQALGLPVEGMLGHSVGEYAAACLAGVFTVEDALALVVERGRLVAALPGGAMLALGESEAETLALLADSGGALALAAVNGARSCVVSGPEPAIAALEERLERLGRPGRRLQTSHAFHSPMLAPAAEALAEAVARFRPKAPCQPFISNVTGSWITPAEATDPAYWARHLLAPVRFADGLVTLRQAGIDLAVECGPGQSLSALARAGGMTALPSLAPAAETPPGGTRLAAAASGLWLEGVTIDWPALHPHPRRRVELPLYPFERRPYRPEKKPEATPKPAPAGKRPSQSEWFYRPGWIAAETAAADLAGPWLILADSGGVGAALAARLQAAGEAVRLVEGGEEADYRALLQAEHTPPRRILHLRTLDEAAPETLEERGLHDLLALMQGIGSVLPGAALRLDIATIGAADVTGAEALRPDVAAAVGAAKVLPFEYPDVTVRILDLDPAPAEAMAEMLMRELALLPADTAIALRDGMRWRQTVAPLPLSAQPVALRRESVILITGGFGGVGTAIARDMAREPGMRLILLGRRPLPEPAAWDGLIAADDPVAPRLRLVRELEALGAQVMTAAPDLSDPKALATTVREAVARFGPITGAVHAAGLADQAGIVQNRTRAQTETVLAPKIAGTRALVDALSGQPLDFLALCSTLGSFLPGAKFGQVAYAAANDYLDLAAAAIARRTGWRAVAINWDDWVEAGMTVEAHKNWGVAPPIPETGLTAREGAAVLRRILAADHRRVAVSVRDLPALINQAASHFETPPPRRQPLDQPAPMLPVVDAEADPLVAELTAAFRQVLDDPDLGGDDSFFERGGHSLLAMRVIGRLRERFGLPLGIAVIFDHPTPRRLAGHLRGKITVTREAS